MLMGLRRLPIGSARPETPQRGGLFGLRERCGGESIQFFPGSRSCVASFGRIFSHRWLAVVLRCFLGESVCFGLSLGFLRVLRIPWRVGGSCEWLGKCGFGMLNQAGFWPVLGWIGGFWGELWDGLYGSWAWTVGSVIRFLEVSRGVRRL